MRLGAIVLCGGKSSRMGVAKADLPFGDETMLARVVRRLAAVADPIVVVTAPGQRRPALPVACRFAEDARPDRGPLEGLAAGLRAFSAGAGDWGLGTDGKSAGGEGTGGLEVDAVYATSCDVPLLAPAFVTALGQRLGDDEIAVPYDGRFHHPLSAIYRVGVLEAIERMLSAERLRPADLFDEVATVRVAVDDLRAFDPRLDTLRNINRPQEYLSALAEVGLAAPSDVIARLRRDA